MRVLVFAAVLGAVFGPATAWPTALAEDIIPATTAERYGLVRPWIAQVELDRGRSRLQDLVLYEGTLYALTNRGVITALDAETGQTLWAKPIGRPDHPTLTPGVFHDLLATLNGSRLYVLNRYNGDVLFETQVTGAPGAGPALSAKRAYIPMVAGMVMAYRLEPLTDPLAELGKLHKKDMSEEEKKQAEKAAEEERRQNIRLNQDYKAPLACQSLGRALVQPLVTLQNREEEYCVWPTDRGYVNVGYVDLRSDDSLVIKYRLQTGAAIYAQPSYLPPDPKVVGDSGTIYAASGDGYVYALLERSGELLWKFSTGEPILDGPVVIEDRVFACTQSGGLFCLDAKSGKQLWWAGEITHFLAAGKHRIYVADKIGRIRILDGANGGLTDILPISPMSIMLTNSQTDRVYVATDTGLVQCLHDVEQVKPIQYGESRKPLPEAEPVKPGLKKSKAGGGDGEKVAKRPPAKKAAPKKAKADDAADDAGGGLDDQPKAKPAKKAAKAKAAKGKAKADDADAGANPFGGQ